ncbi:glycosyltransferase [Jiangella alkaliphila]|uniref:Glycosyltransferase involved in cell wall bisynthesis n=1 Tax=Jiangella alkaliphila TaxID=419479 RepID=A0A1H2LZQ6_9ACTN|nr:glycosyltransferase family 2 protein [Jiangella alkaliphila]SDU86342.1 Glycosyltransferase involved in cell wall bisynthesis [Jiangella alkaliphila]
MSPTARTPDAVPRQDWTTVQVPELGTWTPTLTVTVVLPAKDCQDELELTLAALAAQSYPAELLDVIVVDDASAEPLRLPAVHPARARVLRLPPGDGHGSGRARHAGAEAATGDIVLFLDADIVATRTHVEAHARWHHTAADAVVLGHKLFVDFDDITAADVLAAARDDTFDRLLEGRKQKKHTWLEDFIREAGRLTTYADDTFIAVVGASVSAPRSLYTESGGFSTFGLRGIVDTEFGYRIFTAGAVIVPEPAARSYHQGTRNFAVRGDEIKRERSGLAANHLPIPLFRPSDVGRMWQVPVVHAVVDASGGTPEDVQVTVDSLLASAYTDLVVTVSPSKELPRWIEDYFAADARVRFAPEPVRTGFPAPFSLIVPAGAAVGRSAVGSLLALSASEQVGLVRATVSDEPGPPVELWATRALHRARRHAGTDGLDETARRLFGVHWVSGAEIGVRPAVVGVTKQGMLVEASAAD